MHFGGKIYIGTVATACYLVFIELYIVAMSLNAVPY